MQENSKNIISDEKIRKTLEKVQGLSEQDLSNIAGGQGVPERFSAEGLNHQGFVKRQDVTMDGIGSEKIRTGDTRTEYSTDPEEIRKSVFGAKFDDAVAGN